MRVGLQGWGSEGDLRPLVALAARLRSRGHETRLVVTPVDGKDYRPLCESLGVPLKAVPEKMAVTLQQLVRDARSADPTKLITKVLDVTFFPYLEEMYAASLDLCAASDVVVGGPTCWQLKAASLHAGVPFVALDYVPGIVPSRRIPPAILPEWRWLARPAWALMGLMFDMAFREAPRKFFAAKGLPPIRHAIPDVLFSDHLNLHAASPSFWPAAPDWSEIHCVCGEFFMPLEAEAWAPSRELRAFLDEGPAPVLMTLGSWEHMAPGPVRTLLVESARHSKMRTIIQTKTTDEEGRDGELYFLPWAPHRHLAPFCSAVVHHGGAGTTHMALRAGKPSVVLPFILEQRMWANRVERVGAGNWLSFWKATPQKVASRIQSVAASSSHQLRASQMATAMAGEDGTGVAATRLEGLVSSHPIASRNAASIASTGAGLPV
jgi:UDP:flavonoid glycosyltransferase YjiC (YdhE family)